MLLPHTSIFIKRMSCYIYTKNFFLSFKKILLLEFRNIRNLHLKALFILFTYKVKERHLPWDSVFILLNSRIYHSFIYVEHASSCMSKCVKCTCKYQMFHSSFINYASHSRYEILHWMELSVIGSLFNNCADCRPSHALYRIKSESYIFTLNAKISHWIVDINRKNLNSHLPCRKNIFCNLACLIRNTRYKPRHILYRKMYF